MFSELKGNGRVWIHTSNRALNETEQEQIKNQFNSFLSQWAAHGQQLKGNFDIFYNQVLVLAVDEDFESATGCSIDSAFQIFKNVDANLDLQLFDRLNLAFLIADELKIIRLAELNTAYQAGLLNDESILLDNSIAELDALRSKWKLRFKDSWAFKKVNQLA
ncbi:MAG: hypothetical protein JXR19_06545 [Bacteroidia bacterium]